MGCQKGVHLWQRGATDVLGAVSETSPLDPPLQQISIQLYTGKISDGLRKM